jgi:hypothetical protein
LAEGMRSHARLVGGGIHGRSPWGFFDEEANLSLALDGAVFKRITVHPEWGDHGFELASKGRNPLNRSRVCAALPQNIRSQENAPKQKESYRLERERRRVKGKFCGGAANAREDALTT